MDPATSVVRFATRALFGLLPVRGAFSVGHVRIVVAETAEESSVDVVVQAAGFDSGNRQCNDHVRSADYLNAAVHPEITFRSPRLERSGTGGCAARPVDRAGHHGNGCCRPGARCLRRSALHGPWHHDDRQVHLRVTKAKGMTGRCLEIVTDVSARPA
ncbi:YceI family protein [Streptomyces chumphonensis]|uniref:YceI family protein n=1 Tax=Streptomyces chumphonensis TaxID=1214925 RepID=UPI003D70F257